MVIYTISWTIGILGIAVGVGGGIWYMNALKNLGGELKKSQFGIFMASALWMLYSALMIFLALMHIPLSHPAWNLVPIGFTITAITYMYGTYKLVDALKQLNS